MTALFDIQNLRISTSRRCLLNIAQLSIPKGQLVAIIGANGAGKSTLLNSLLGKMNGYTMTGRIHCLGKPIEQAVKSGQIAWVGQHEQFELPLTALEYTLLGDIPNLAWYQKPNQHTLNIAKSHFETFELDHLIHQRITHLSGGEKQRLAIIRALVQNSQVLLLDEPSNHLDIKHERMIFAHLKQLTQQQKSIVVVLHSLTHAYRFADTVIAMHQGEVIKTGAPWQVMDEQTLYKLYDTHIYQYQTQDGAIFL